MISQVETCEVFTVTGSVSDLPSMLKTWPLPSRWADKEKSIWS